MLHTQKQASIIPMFFLVFTALLFNSSLYAEVGEERLTQTSVNSIDCTKAGCFFPSPSITNKDIVVSGEVVWDRGENKKLVLHTKGNVIFEDTAKLTIKNDASFILKVGMEPGSKDAAKLGKLIFKSLVYLPLFISHASFCCRDEMVALAY